MKQLQKDYSSSDSNNIILSLPKLVFCLLLCLFLSLSLTSFSFKSLSTPSLPPPNNHPSVTTHITLPDPAPQPQPDPTQLRHVVFGIGAAANKWARRKEFIKLWWVPNATRGYVFLDRHVDDPGDPNEHPTLQLKVSEDTSSFGYSYRHGSRSALRMTRIVSEIIRATGSDPGQEEIRWVVMGDDDTVFFPSNLVRVLQKYDHNKMYYIGSNSETHVQNINFAYDMAFGGGGFAISYPLALEIEKMQDSCIQRYTSLYGSDDRIHACLAELGVPLTKEPGFHQFDVHGNLFGLLTAHPVAPLVSLHHLEIVDPIFPYMGRLQALQRLKIPTKLDPESLMQQSICYDSRRNWTISVSWGYAVQIIRGSIPPREMQRPARTFFNWQNRDEPSSFSFNTRPFSKHPCEKPYIYYLFNAMFNNEANVTASEYVMHRMPHPWCWWPIDNPERVHRVQVYKKLTDPHKWDEAPRRDCCRVLQADKKNTVAIDVGECKEGEVMEPLLS
ncbi:Beta-1 3-glucosyltransferase [Bienertia sinuspersici]